MKFITSFFLILLCPFVSADVAVIVNPAVSDVSSDDIKRIFLGKKSSFSDGSEATPYYLPESVSERAIFDKQALGKSSSQIKAYWSKLVFTGKGSPPGELDSSQEAKIKVATEKDAIAYIDASLVDDTVKVVAKFP